MPTHSLSFIRTATAAASTTAMAIAISSCQPLKTIHSGERHVIGAVSSRVDPPREHEEAVGQIRLQASPQWCITHGVPASAGDPLYVEPCIRGDSSQVWVSTRTGGNFGQSYVYGTHLAIGQKGALDVARLVDNSGSDPDSVFLLHFNQAGNAWYVDIATKGPKVLTAPSKLVRGVRVYKLSWQLFDDTIPTTREWLFSPWKTVSN